MLKLDITYDYAEKCLDRNGFRGSRNDQNNWPNYGASAIAQWIRLRLRYCGSGFESRAQHLHFFQFIFELWREKNEINKNGPGLAPIYTSTSVQWTEVVPLSKRLKGQSLRGERHVSKNTFELFCLKDFLADKKIDGGGIFEKTTQNPASKLMPNSDSVWPDVGIKE